MILGSAGVRGKMITSLVRFILAIVLHLLPLVVYHPPDFGLVYLLLSRIHFPPLYLIVSACCDFLQSQVGRMACNVRLLVTCHAHFREEICNFWGSVYLNSRIWARLLTSIVHFRNRRGHLRQVADSFWELVRWGLSQCAGAWGPIYLANTWMTWAISTYTTQLHRSSLSRIWLVARRPLPLALPLERDYCPLVTPPLPLLYWWCDA